MIAMKLLFAALLAALVSFVWGFCSWMLLGWHSAGMREFKDEAAVAKVIRENATHGTSIYMLPFPRKPMSYADDEAKAKLTEEIAQATTEGPFIYATVRPGRRESNMGMSLGLSFGRSFLAALALGALLSQTVLSFPGKLAFCAGAGVFAGLACVLPQWIWFELPLREVLVGMADYFIEWLLSGIVLALFLGRVPTSRDHG